MKMALIGWISPYGGLPSAISKAVMPRLQMSATQSYPISWITSGAIQNGVPMTVFLLAIVSYNTAVSDSLHVPHTDILLLKTVTIIHPAVCRTRKKETNDHRTQQILYNINIATCFDLARSSSRRL